MCRQARTTAAHPPQRGRAVLILEGRFSVLANGEWTKNGPGGVAYTPRGNVHTFRNIGDTTGRFWGIATPSGFETFFARCAVVFAADGPPDMSRIGEIIGEHGLVLPRHPQNRSFATLVVESANEHGSGRRICTKAGLCQLRHHRAASQSNLIGYRNKA